MPPRSPTESRRRPRRGRDGGDHEEHPPLAPATAREHQLGAACKARQAARIRMVRATCTGCTEKSTRSTEEGGLGSGRRLHARFTMKGLAASGKTRIFPLQSKFGIVDRSGIVSPLCGFFVQEFMVQQICL